MTLQDWTAEGERRFGSDQMKWKFICPSCGYIATPLDWKTAGAPESAIAFSCIGRWKDDAGEMYGKKQPCNYAGGGLFRLNPVDVDGHSVFAFADEFRQATAKP